MNKKNLYCKAFISFSSSNIENYYSILEVIRFKSLKNIEESLKQHYYPELHDNFIKFLIKNKHRSNKMSPLKKEMTYSVSYDFTVKKLIKFNK